MPGTVSAVSAALVLAATVGGCAGARVTVTADRAAYPISLSDSVADGTGKLWTKSQLVKVGTFETHRTSIGFLYSRLTPRSMVDVSEELNTQVAASAGEAVVGLAISSSGACGLNAVPVLTILPIWPGCVHVVLTGDIVRRPARAKVAQPAEPAQPGLRPLAAAPTTVTANTRPLK
jgi:hypothetical protein